MSTPIAREAVSIHWAAEEIRSPEAHGGALILCECAQPPGRVYGPYNAASAEENVHGFRFGGPYDSAGRRQDAFLVQVPVPCLGSCTGNSNLSTSTARGVCTL